jgi:hypothetical protein
MLLRSVQPARVSRNVELAFVLLLGIIGACLPLLACAQVKEVGGEIGGHVAEWIACPTDLIDCGHVYQCAQLADTPSGFIEICVDDDDHPEDLDAVEALYGICEPTPRHEGLCIFCCGPDCGRGGNAYSGTYCP